MKKLLVLMLVLVLTSITGASNVDKAMQLTVNGEVVDEITLDVLDVVELGITMADGWDIKALEIDLETIGPATITLPEDPYDIIGGFDWNKYIDGVTPTGIAVIAAVWPGSVTGRFVTLIDLHCGGVGDVLVQITDIGTNNSPTHGEITQEMMGSIVIHQIPEPMTVALLGLGSLALLRKRR